MKREQSAPERRSQSRPESSGSEVWTITKGDPAYPSQLVTHPRAADWYTLHGRGNRSILRQKCLGLICSVQCPGSVVIKTFDAIRELRDAGVVMAGGFHSPMEQQCLDFLLRGNQPIIICAARNLSEKRLPAVWRTAIDASRLLLVSPFGNDVRRITKAQAQTRNEFVSVLSSVVLIPHASPGGSAEATARNVIERGKPVFTLNDKDSPGIRRLGALEYDFKCILGSIAISK